MQSSREAHACDLVMTGDLCTQLQNAVHTYILETENILNSPNIHLHNVNQLLIILSRPEHKLIQSYPHANECIVSLDTGKKNPGLPAVSCSKGLHLVSHGDRGAVCKRQPLATGSHMLSHTVASLAEMQKPSQIRRPPQLDLLRKLLYSFLPLHHSPGCLSRSTLPHF